MPIDYDVTEGCATIRINRPEALNALDPDSMLELRLRLTDARDDRDVRVLIVTGAGDRAFCTGADLKKTLPPKESFAEAFWLAEEAATAGGLYVRALDLSDLELWKPLIAAINGYCIGGGLELALQADIRIASTDSSFGFPEAAIGSIPAVGGLHRLLRAIPSSIAMQMALTGNRLSAEDAYRVGLVSELWPPSELLPNAARLAERIAANAPLAIQAIKRLAAVGFGIPLREAILLDQMTWGILRDTADRIEGRKAFAEGRKPRFEGM